MNPAPRLDETTNQFRDRAAAAATDAAAATSATWQQVVAGLQEHEKTPLVRLLLAVIEQQAQQLVQQHHRIAELEAEVARLQGGPKKPASNSKPSALSKPAPAEPAPDGKRPGSQKRSKTEQLTIHEEVPVRPKDLPPVATLVRTDPYVVQDLRIHVHNIRYLVETWRTPTGVKRRGALPPGVIGHFGAELRGFVLQQHYGAHVPQCRILEELRDWGVDISAGQINQIVTEKQERFHQEKDALLPTALQVFTALSVDDSGAPHRGNYGSCLCLCNDLFTSFHSSASKERSKFLDVLRCGQRDYVLNDAAWAYLQDQALPAKVLRLLKGAGPTAAGATERLGAEQTFVDATAWQDHLDRLAIANAKQRQTLTEAALLGSAVAHGVPRDLGLVSDGSPIYALFVHGLCWVHQERNLAKLTPCGDQQRVAHADTLSSVRQLYADLKAYRVAPTPAQAEVLRIQFDSIVKRTTGWAELDAALQRMAARKDELLRVLERPDLPLHTNTAERAFRDWATKRKISAGTRGEEGRRSRDTWLSLKQTCKKLAVGFYAFIRDRLLGAGKIPLLSELLRQKAASPATI